MSDKEKWIQKAVNPENKGELRRKTHTKKGKNISADILEKESHSKNKKTREQANFAINVRKSTRNR